MGIFFDLYKKMLRKIRLRSLGIGCPSQVFKHLVSNKAQLPNTRILKKIIIKTVKTVFRIIFFTLMVKFTILKITLRVTL